MFSPERRSLATSGQCLFAPVDRSDIRLSTGNLQHFSNSGLTAVQHDCTRLPFGRCLATDQGPIEMDNEESGEWCVGVRGGETLGSGNRCGGINPARNNNAGDCPERMW